LLIAYLGTPGTWAPTFDYDTKPIAWEAKFKKTRRRHFDVFVVFENGNWASASPPDKLVMLIIIFYCPNIPHALEILKP
jgi:hypothetical protein